MNAAPTTPDLANDAQRGSHCVQRIVRIPSVERGCKGKANLGRKYAKAADRLSRKHGKTYGVYRCPHCGGTHLTTKLDIAARYFADLLYTSNPNAELRDRHLEQTPPKKVTSK